MKVSIITVCFNSERTIDLTITSVLEQEYENVEYIIIDGNSTDNTLKIVQSYGHRIKHIISEKDNGIYDAMNKGIKLASGEIIGILNSDDVFFNNQVLTDIMESFKISNADCVYGNIVYFKNTMHEVKRVWETSEYYSEFFENGKVPPHPALFVKKSIYEKIGFYRTDFKIAADQEFMIRLLKKHNCVSAYLDKFIVRMRLGGASTSGFKSYWISTKEIRKAWEVNNLKYPFKLYFIRPISKIFQLRF